MKLYGYWRSSSAHRVRIALGLKNVDYERVFVHLVRDGGQQNSDEYRTINPMNQVPVLEFEHQGQLRRIAQSVAIVEYLEERFPTPALLPSDLWERAHVRELVELINSGIQPLQNTSTLKRLMEQSAGVDVAAWLRHFIARGLRAFEARAVECADRYAFGDAVTLADVFLIPQLTAARRFDVDLSEFPTLLRVEQNCASLEAFARAEPKAQPDAEQNAAR